MSYYDINARIMIKAWNLLIDKQIKTYLYSAYKFKRVTKRYINPVVLLYFIYHSRAYSKIYFHTLKKISVTSEDRYLWNNMCNLHKSFCTCHLLLWLAPLLCKSPVAVAMSPVAVACSSSVHITCCCGLLLLWRCSNALCASGFVDDVLSSYLPMVQAVS